MEQQIHLTKEIIFWGSMILYALYLGNPRVIHDTKVSAWQQLKLLNDATWSEKDKRNRQKYLHKIEHKHFVEKIFFLVYFIVFWASRWFLFYILA